MAAIFDLGKVGNEQEGLSWLEKIASFSGLAPADDDRPEQLEVPL